MAGPATLKIDIIADVAKAAKGIDKIDQKLGGLAKLATGAAIAGGAVVAGKAVLDLGAKLLDAGEAGAAITRTTEQLIATTGNAANTTAGYLENLANSLARQTGVSDDSIQSAQNLLLTFNKLSNEVDDGTGVFDRATKAALDLAGAGFGDVESNAKQLGKALQDPVKGMAALAEAGVTFSAQEQETIRTLQESGRLFEAQQIVLAGVEGQVKGAAEASATSSAKLGVAWDQTLETLGTSLLPIVDKLLPTFQGLLDKLVPAVLPVVDIIADLAGELIDALLPAIEPLLPVIAELARTIAGQLAEVIRQLAPLLPDLTNALADLITELLPIIPTVVKLSSVFLPLLPLLVDLTVVILELATRALKELQPVLRQVDRLVDDFSYSIKIAVGWVRDLIDWVGRALSKVADLIRQAGRIPGLGFLGGIIGFEAPGPATFGTAARRSPRSTSTRIQVDVTGVGFDSILTGRAIARQLTDWERSNGITPVAWAQRNGGLPA